MFSIQVYDSHGEIRKTAVIESYPFTIGRALSNDLRLEDPSVSANHAVVEERADGIVLKNLSQTNRIFYQGQVRDEVALNHQAIVYLGKVRLVFLEDSTLREKTQEVNIHDIQALHRKNAPWYVRDRTSILFTLGLIGLGLIDHFVHFSEDTLLKVIMKALMGVGILTFTAVGFSIASKLYKRGFRFTEFFDILLAWAFYAVVMEWLQALRWYSRSDIIKDIVEFVPPLILSYYFLYRLSRRLHPAARRRSIHAVWLCVGIIGAGSVYTVRNGHKGSRINPGPVSAKLPYRLWYTTDAQAMTKLENKIDEMADEIGKEIDQLRKEQKYHF